MSRRAVINGLLLVALAAFVVWIARNTYWVEEAMPRPLSGEAARDPFYAARRLAEQLGARAATRHTVSDLPEGGVLLLAGWNWSLIETRRHTIEQWVERGGRLVLDRDVLSTDGHLRDWSGLSRLRVKAGGEPVETVDDETAGEGRHGCGPLHVRHDAEGVSRYRQQYRVCTIPALEAIASDPEPLWALGDDEGFQAVRVRVGKGSVTWLNAQPFQRRELFDVDHALLFAAATQVRAGDVVVFVSEEEQPSIVVLMWRHGGPAVVLFLAWLASVLWRNGVRFGPPAPATVAARRSLAEQIQGTSEFTRRFGGGGALHAAEARALQEAAAKRIPRFRSMNQDERLVALAALTGIDAERLGETLNYAGPRRPLELKRALELLEQARRNLEHSPTDSRGRT